MRVPSPIKRPGVSLLEVIVALAIFLFSLVAIGQLINFGSDRALDAQLYQEAAFKCQSLLAEYAAGAVALSSQSETSFEEDPAWFWSSDCVENPDVPGLWHVTVTVYRAKAFDSRASVTLSQMIVDPTLRGSTFNAPPKEPEAEQMTEDSSSSSTTTTGGN